MAYSQILTAQVVLASTTGETADSAVMTFAIGDDLPWDSADYSRWSDSLQGLMSSFQQNNMLNGYAQTGHRVKIYNPKLPRPNYPLFEEEWDLLTPPGAPDLPREVAACVSYYNTFDTDVPRARRRGRFYVPGLAKAHVDEGRPTSTFINALVSNYTQYLTTLGDGWIGNAFPVVYSRVNQEGYLANRFYVDNEFDTQRRRGAKPTSRTYGVGWGG